MGTLVNYCAGAGLKKRPQKAKAFLFSVPEHGSTPGRIEKTKQLVQETQPEHIMVDSGGFQKLSAENKGWTVTHAPERELIYKPGSGEMNLAPNHVMDFAAMMKANIVIGLDFPVGKFKTTAECEVEFQRKFPINVKWAYESAEWRNRLCPDARLFLPFQGYTIEHLNEFFSKISGLQYDGISFPLRNMKFHDLALSMASFRQRDVDSVHLLGTAKFEFMALAAFMSHDYFKWVSLDATTWNTAAVYCRFLNPHNLGSVNLNLKKKIDPNATNDCPCQFCQDRSFKEIQEMPSIEKRELLRQHNWWAIDKAVRDLENNSKDLVQLERFLKDRDVKPSDIDSLINILALVDCLKDEDAEVLQTILAPVPKPGKLNRKTRMKTSADSRPRQRTRDTQRPTMHNGKKSQSTNKALCLEQNLKSLQEEF